mmetsp:Transcript_37116/g.106231  ORF Transcript_37116/g.106231 Transcript_37116/m.106231 type:complete len:120 (+) Transcript_37116:89-448(+)
MSAGAVTPSIHPSIDNHTGTRTRQTIATHTLTHDARVTRPGREPAKTQTDREGGREGGSNDKEGGREGRREQIDNDSREWNEQHSSLISTHTKQHNTSSRTHPQPAVWLTHGRKRERLH